MLVAELNCINQLLVTITLSLDLMTFVENGSSILNGWAKRISKRQLRAEEVWMNMFLYQMCSNVPRQTVMILLRVRCSTVIYDISDIFTTNSFQTNLIRVLSSIVSTYLASGYFGTPARHLSGAIQIYLKHPNALTVVDKFLSTWLDWAWFEVRYDTMKLQYIQVHTSPHRDEVDDA